MFETAEASYSRDRPFERASGCPMVEGLYLKANGELPCWAHIGEQRILKTVDKEWLDSDEGDLLMLPAIVEIRQAFSEGRMPYPQHCQHCVYYGDGSFKGLRPEHFDRVYVEPSYLCGLDCPACISPKVRLTLKKPPYYLEPALFEATLARLQREGLQSIKIFHFEGRGDPLLNRQFPELTRIAKRFYPMATTMVTTHGSYPFRPDILDCGLDELRLSLDGATAETYAKYRRGGDFNKVIAWLHAIRAQRRRARSRLQVVWKYILFEWNDSPEEILAAARMSDELEAQLLFVFSQSQGRSERLIHPDQLAEILAEAAPRANISGRRFPWNSRRTPEEDHQQEVDCATLLTQTLEEIRQGRRAEAVALLDRALRLDPGLPDGTPPIGVDEKLPPVQWVDHIVRRARHPNTLSALAYLAELDGNWRPAYLLQRRYLQIGPETPMREVFEGSLLRFALHAHLGSDQPHDFLRRSQAQLGEAERAVLAIDPGHREAGPIAVPSPPEEWVAELLLPATARILGYLRWAGRDYAAARVLFEAYLATGEAADEAEIRKLLARMAAGDRFLYERAASKVRGLLPTQGAKRGALS